MKLSELEMRIDERTAGDHLIEEVEKRRRHKKAYWPLLREVAGYWTREFLEVTDRYHRIVDVYQAVKPDKTYPNTAHIELGEHNSIDGGTLRIMARVSVKRATLVSDISFTAENSNGITQVILGNESFKPPYSIGLRLPEDPEGWADTYYGQENPETGISGAVSGLASVIRPARETQAMLFDAMSSVELNPAITPDLLKQYGLMPSYR